MLWSFLGVVVEGAESVSLSKAERSSASSIHRKKPQPSSLSGQEWKQRSLLGPSFFVVRNLARRRGLQLPVCGVEVEVSSS